MSQFRNFCVSFIFTFRLAALALAASALAAAACPCTVGQHTPLKRHYAKQWRMHMRKLLATGEQCI